MYVWNGDGDTAFLITVFKAGPFRVGYLGFPTGGILGNPLESSHIEDLRRLKLPLDVLRVPVSGFGPTSLSTEIARACCCARAPETAIANLQGWTACPPEKVRRALRRAARIPFSTADLKDGVFATDLYELYRDTVSRNAGSLRYTSAYFAEVIRLAASHPALRCLGAISEDYLIGFLVVALEGSYAYYLHGGTRQDCTHRHVADVLMADAIGWAEAQGMSGFNFMASPQEQPGVIRFKEKFGGRTELHCAYELALHPARAGILRLMMRGHDVYAQHRRHLTVS
ncbi:GNAT family N-acetyltransferase [Thiohalocapsa marina]|uniref:GNAT family N-acetyltransferase n=1 Tax=Thiohalocapsa marina TaxID=424902 RepID=UPI0036DD3677